MAILHVNQVTKRFGGLVAVSKLDLAIEPGAIYSVIGPNGAGKTTFFNCITGFFPADEGEILFNGTPIQSLRPDKVAHLGISRTYQNIRLFPTMTALENIMVGLHHHLHASWIGAVLSTPRTRKEEEYAHEEARRLLRFVNLRGKGDVLARNLPYGDQRRLEVARALATKPKLLLLDEPTAGMGHEDIDRISMLIKRVAADRTVLMVEHNLSVVSDLSDTITVLTRGRVLAEGDYDTVSNNPDVREAYMGVGHA